MSLRKMVIFTHNVFLLQVMENASTHLGMYLVNLEFATCQKAGVHAFSRVCKYVIKNKLICNLVFQVLSLFSTYAVQA